MSHQQVLTESPPKRLASRRNTVAMVLACGFLLAFMLWRGHATGGEIWGLVAAFAAFAASILALAVRPGGSRVGLAAVVLLWMVAISLGVAGTFDHAAPVLPHYLDQRPRPPLVPLIYAMYGVVGIAMAVSRSRGDTRVWQRTRELD